MAAEEVLDRLDDVSHRPRELSPADFDTSANSTGKESRIARLRADSPLALLGGERHPLKLAIPCFENLGTTDGTADNTETFTLGNDVTKCPDTQDVVVWLDGSFYGAPDSTDYANNKIDVTDSGTGSTVRVYYIVDEPATLKFYRRSKDGNVQDNVFTVNVSLVQDTNQSEQPETIQFSGGPFERFVATDQTLDIAIDAPYPVQYSESTDGTEATNALLSIDVQQGQSEVPGLAREVRQSMS